MEEKYPRGTRVEILSRFSDSHDAKWENTSYGSEAIIEHSSLNVDAGEIMPRIDRDETAPLYYIAIIRKNKILSRSWWYEEKYLQIVCTNLEKGLRILRNCRDE